MFALNSMTKIPCFPHLARESGTRTETAWGGGAATGPLRVARNVTGQADSEGADAGAQTRAAGAIKREAIPQPPTVTKRYNN